MSNFLPNRVKNIRGWIPEVDVDGIDLPKETFVSETENLVYENGFFRNEKKPRSHTIPFNLTGDEVLLSVTTFYHTTRGRVWVYIIWNSVTSQMYLYLSDGVGFSDYVYVNTGIVHWANKVEFVHSTSINYAEFDDTLKINFDGGQVRLTNTTGIIIRQWQIGNYSLEYIDDDYDYILGTGEWERVVGWKLSVRWLGSSYHQYSVVEKEEYGVSRVQTVSPEIGDDDTNANGVLIIDEVNMLTNAHVNSGDTDVTAGVGHIVFDNGEQIVLDGFYTIDGIRLNFIQNPDSNTIKITACSSVDPSGNPLGIITEVTLSNSAFVSLDVINTPCHIIIKNEGTVGTAIHISNIYYYPISSYVMLTSLDKTGQITRVAERDLMLDNVDTDKYNQPVADPLPMFSRYITALIPTLDYDIRDDIEDWEFYYRLLSTENKYSLEVVNVYQEDAYGNNLFIKADVKFDTQAVDTMTIEAVVEDALSVRLEVTEITDSVDTLNFRYGLGATVLPFPIIDSIVGHNIKNEIYYKNRSYIVKGDKNIYLSHIAGNGKLQSDSFPYSEEVEFGYVYGDNSDDRLVAIAVTPLDELLVLSSVSGLVYVIQATSSTVFRKIKATNGNVGIGSVDSLIRNNAGKSLAEVLLWSDEKGTYLYGGGIGQPKNVVEGQLDNYWKSFFNTSLIGAYNPMRNEALFISGDLAVVLDLGTLTWRKIRFTTQVVEFIGIVDYKPYFLLDDNTIVYLDDSDSNQIYLSGALVTHYQTNYAIDDRGNFIPLGEMTDKILQELYVSMHQAGVNTGAPMGIDYDVIVDSNVITPRVTFSGEVLFSKVKAPLLVRYRMIKIRVTLSASGFSVKEIGYTFNVKNSIMTDIPDGQGIGFGNNFGNDFGVYL